MDAWARRLLAERAEVEEVVVFGSFEQDTYAPGSDLDVLIVLAHAAEPARDRVPALLPGAFPVPVDVFPFTREELDARRGSPVVVAAGKSRWRYLREPYRRPR